MTKRNVMICIVTSRNEAARELPEDDIPIEEIEFDDLTEELPEPSEMWIEGRLITSADRVELVYEESELTGMEGSTTSIGFQRQEPTLVSMIRTGIVRTALIFEAGKRHTSIYTTPFSEMELCVRALSVENRLLTEGSMTLDYLIEIHGLQAERCRMQISVHDDRP